MKKSRMSVTRGLGLYAILAAVSVSLVCLASATTVFAADKSFTCTPVNVAVFPKPSSSRVHVKCSPADGSIAFFALGVKDDGGDANRVLSILSTAIAANKQLTIIYETESNNVDAKSVCLGKQDCRLIRGVVMF